MEMCYGVSHSDRASNSDSPSWMNSNVSQHDTGVNGQHRARYHELQRNHVSSTHLPPHLHGGILDSATSIPIDVKPTIQAAQLAGYSGTR